MYKAVIVDDEYYVRYGLEHTIAWDEHGIELVATASNGKQALEEIQRHSPQLVITDVKMPTMTGLELLREIRAHHPGTKVIVVSGFDDFAYVKECLVYGVENYILKPIDSQEISQTISSAVAKIESEELEAGEQPIQPAFLAENILLRLVNDSITHEQAVERFGRLDIDVDADSYAVAIIRVLQGDPANRQRARQSVVEHCQETTNDQTRFHAFGDLAGNVVLLFRNGPDESVDSIRRKVAGRVESINAELDLDVFATVGGIETHLSDVHRSYALAEGILDYSYLYPPNTVITHAEIQDSSAELGRLFRFDHDGFRAHVLSDSKEDVAAFYRSVRSDLVDSGRYPPEHVRSYLIDLAACVIGLMREKKAWEDSDVVEPEMLYQKLFMQHSFGDVIDWLKEITLTFMARLSDRAQRPKGLAEKTVDYVQQHYCEEISLKTIAAEFGANSSYLGRMFKTETGSLFTDYLNELRIEKARELLMTTPEKANVVAKRVGYSDANYFYKVFRKYTGEYPTAFRERT